MQKKQNLLKLNKELRMFVIYGKPLCQYCEMTKKLLGSKGISYTYVNLGDDDMTIERLNEMAGHEIKTVPQILVKDADGMFQYVGSYNELKEMVS